MREWPTWLALVAAYIIWAMATVFLVQVSLGGAILLAGIAAAFHSSLTHEAMHGHPTKNAYINAALVFPALSLFTPYLRFKDTHLTHHKDAQLTDPYKDPESNFMDPKTWMHLSPSMKMFLHVNNTLAGRMLIGPVLSQINFMGADFAEIKSGNRRILFGWLLHIPSVGLVIWWAYRVGEMPGWAYVAAGYVAISLLKIRTFLEHRAHIDAPARIVVVESRGPLALLFLNNSFHIVHHTHPQIAWYEMPRLYRENPAYYRGLNGGYIYQSYTQIFQRYFLRIKDPVPHPLWRKGD